MQDAGTASRLFGLLFVAIVVLAIAALLAGYGVPVGVGALAGLILGASAGVTGALWLARGTGRSITLGGAAWSSDDLSGSPSPGLLAEMQELSELQTIDLGGIRALVPVLATVEAGGLTVQLVAAEIHEAGVSLTVDARPQPGVSPPPSAVRVSVTDDVETAYRASGQGQGGSPIRIRYEIAVIPAPPSASTQLNVRIDEFADLFPGARRGVVGPWLFTVALRRSDT